MKKIAFFSVIGILLCVLTGSQAYAGYKIVWWGDFTGSIPTGETAKTEQASIELFNQLFPNRTPYPEGTCLIFDDVGIFCDYPPGCCISSVPVNCVGDEYWGIPYQPNSWEVCEYGSFGYWMNEGGSSGDRGDHWTAGYWDVLLDVVPDGDGDGISDASDNCPTVFNYVQKDADNNTIGDLCDAGTVYGTTKKNWHSTSSFEDVTVSIYNTSCGDDILVATATTDEFGYYSFGGLETGRYLLVASEKTGYPYVYPASVWVDIPQEVIQPYDFQISYLDYW